ncbi:hypothetical protein COOONC_04180 [Cooperia oncophora]
MEKKCMPLCKEYFYNPKDSHVKNSRCTTIQHRSDDNAGIFFYLLFYSRDGILGVQELIPCEAFSGDDLAVPDIWESLYRLGYDNSLQLHYACPFSILIDCDNDVITEPQLTIVTRTERDQILRGLYYQGKSDSASDITAHIYATEYFGMMIVKNEKKDEKKTYRIEIAEEKNVKWNFVHGRDDIDITTCGDWVSCTSRPFPGSAGFSKTVLETKSRQNSVNKEGSCHC